MENARNKKQERLGPRIAAECGERQKAKSSPLREVRGCRRQFGPNPLPEGEVTPPGKEPVGDPSTPT